MPTIIIILAILGILLLYILLTYNRLINRRNMVENQKSQIDVELQRRFDLIPNLVEVVKGYAKHESKTLEDVISARNNYITVEQDTQEALASNQELTQALSRLFMLTENYPELKADAQFLSLQEALTKVEKQIAYSRQFYNDSVYRMNNLIDMFPSNIVATLFRFKKQAFFETKDSQRSNIKVDVDNKE